MSGWSPPPPFGVLVGIGLLSAIALAYAVVIQGSILLGVFPGVLIVVAYVLLRILVAVEAVADALHRIADQRERD